MKRKFIQCKFCKKGIPLDSCELATHRTLIDGEEYVFCCEKCAELYLERKN